MIASLDGWMSIYIWVSSVLGICLIFNPLILCMISLLSSSPFPSPSPTASSLSIAFTGNIVHQLLTAAATSLAILGIYASAIYLSSLSSILCLLLWLLLLLPGFLKTTEVINFQKIVEGSKTIDGIWYTQWSIVCKFQIATHSLQNTQIIFQNLGGYTSTYICTYILLCIW